MVWLWFPDNCFVTHVAGAYGWRKTTTDHPCSDEVEVVNKGRSYFRTPEKLICSWRKAVWRAIGGMQEAMLCSWGANFNQLTQQTQISISS